MKLGLLRMESNLSLLKLNERSYRSMFRAEADQLNLLGKTSTIRLPQVWSRLFPKP